MKKLLVVLGAALALWAWSNISDAMDRSHQKRTMSDIHTIGMAWELRNDDVHAYDPRGARAMHVVPARELERALVPAYLKTLPKVDAWGRPYQFVASANEYFVRSGGRDGRYDHNPGLITSPDGDIVYRNGSFIEYPGGI